MKRVHFMLPYINELFINGEKKVEQARFKVFDRNRFYVALGYAIKKQPESSSRGHASNHKYLGQKSIATKSAS